MKVFTVGSLNMDLVIRSDRVPQKGQTVAGYGFMTNPGGKGANQAVAVAKSGGSVEMVGCVGREFGGQLIDTLKGYGVGTDFVRICDDISSGIAVILVTEGDNRILLDEGANGRLSEEDVSRALENAQAGDLLIVQLEIPLSTVEYALRAAKEKGMTTLLNPAPAKALPASLAAYADYFMPNQTETGFYAGITPQNFDEAEKAATQLRGAGFKNVVITMGDLGAAVFAEKNFIVPAFPADAVDTTAAGDTFVGAFAAELAAGKPLEEAVLYANKAASITVTRRGAQQSIPTREEVE